MGPPLAAAAASPLLAAVDALGVGRLGGAILRQLAAFQLEACDAVAQVVQLCQIARGGAGGLGAGRLKEELVLLRVLGGRRRCGGLAGT